MQISCGGSSGVSVPLAKRGSPQGRSFSMRTPITSIQSGSGCDVVYFGERDFEAGESRLNAVVITRRERRPNAAERALPRNRLREIAAKTRYRVLRWLPWFVRNAMEPHTTQVFCDSTERLLTVDDKVYGPLEESDTLIVMFDALSDPATQTTTTRPAPTRGGVPRLREDATVEEWRAATRSMRQLGIQESPTWWDACVKGVPVAAEFVRESNALAG